MKHECPQCKRPLVSRWPKTCQYCGAPLPESMVASKAEVNAENRRWLAEQEKHRERVKERDNDAVGAGPDVFIPPLGFS